MKTNIIIKWATVIACACALGVASQANAISLTYGDSYSLGSITPGSPDSDAAQVPLINVLIDLAAGNDQVSGAYTYDRTGNFQPGTSLTDAVTLGAAKEDPTDGTFNVGSGYLYLLGKYGANKVPGTDGNAFYVWYIGGLSGEVSIPTSGLSHMSFYNPGRTNTPDGGSMLLLLGGAVTVLGFLRRKISA